MLWWESGESNPECLLLNHKTEIAFYLRILSFPFDGGQTIGDILKAIINYLTRALPGGMGGAVATPVIIDNKDDLFTCHRFVQYSSGTSPSPLQVLHFLTSP